MANGSIIKVIEKGNQKYRCLDYIQATGTQYINLGNFSWNADTDVLETKFKFDTISTTSNALWLYSLQGTSMSFDFYSQNSVFNLRPYQVAQTVYQMEQDTNVHNLKLDSANGKIYLDDVEKFSGIQKSSIGNVQFNLFRRNTGTGYASARLYNFFISRSGEKILDLIPVERISDNAIGLLDLISGTLYTNAGSGTFNKSYQQVEHIYKPKYKVIEGGVEVEVEQVDYIQANGDQYINTGVYLTPRQTVIETKYQWTSQPTLYDRVFGVMDNANTQLSLSCQVSGKQGACFHSQDIVDLGNITINTPYTLKMKNGVITFNGTDYPTITSAGTMQNTLCLFCLNNAGTVSRKSKSRIHYFKITENNVVIRDLIPVKYGTEYCMLDLVEMKLYHNKGTGAFTGGNRVEVKKITQAIFHNNVMYYPLDYLKGNGTSTYINLGIAPKSNTNIELVAYQENDYLGDDRVLIGGGTTWNNNTELVIGVYRSATQHFFEKGLGGIESGTQVIGVKNTYKIQDNKAYINGVVKYTFTNTTINTTYPLFLFALNRHAVTPSTMNYSNARIYSCKIWEGTVLKLDLIPVERASDNAKGMLNLVDGTFYGNSGSGTFGGNKREIILVE